MPTLTETAPARKTSEKRQKQLLAAARVTPAELDLIKARARKAGVSVSELIRRLVLPS